MFRTRGFLQGEIYASFQISVSTSAGIEMEQIVAQVERGKQDP